MIEVLYEDEALIFVNKPACIVVQRGYDAVPIDWRGQDDDLWSRLRGDRIDVVWIALHGTFGEDRCVQGLLERAGVPYTGSGVLASALAMDKVATRRVFDQESIESPRWRRYHGPADAARIGLPLVVKPSCEGSSVGVSIVKSAFWPSASRLSAQYA